MKRKTIPLRVRKSAERDGERRNKMADEFFRKKNCDRCGKPLTVRTMSFFNTDAICPECAEAERKRPDFPAARAAEVAAVKAGDFNFKGVGLGTSEGVKGREK